MKDVEVSVCSESGSCKLCGKVTSKDQKATINCPSPLAGIVVRLESANSNLQICEVTINGVKESGEFFGKRNNNYRSTFFCRVSESVSQNIVVPSNYYCNNYNNIIIYNIIII